MTTIEAGSEWAFGSWEGTLDGDRDYRFRCECGWASPLYRSVATHKAISDHIGSHLDEAGQHE